MLVGTLQFARMEGLFESHSSPLAIDHMDIVTTSLNSEVDDSDLYMAMGQ